MIGNDSNGAVHRPVRSARGTIARFSAPYACAAKRAIGEVRANGEPDEIERDGQGGRSECLRPDVPDEAISAVIIATCASWVNTIGHASFTVSLSSIVKCWPAAVSSPAATDTGCASIICPWKSNYLVCPGRKRLLVPPR